MWRGDRRVEEGEGRRMSFDTELVSDGADMMKAMAGAEY